MIAASNHWLAVCGSVPLTSVAIACAAVTKLRALEGGDSGRLPMGGRSHQQPSVGGPPLKVAACRWAAAAGESLTAFFPLLGFISLWADQGVMRSRPGFWARRGGLMGCTKPSSYSAAAATASACIEASSK